MKDTEMNSQNLVTLLRFDHNEQIAVARSILDNADIESFVRNEYMASILPIEDMAAELMVREEDAACAMQLLESFVKGE